MRIKKKFVTTIDRDKILELQKLEKSGDITHDEKIEMGVELLWHELKCKIDIIGTIKENIKHISDVIKSYAIYYVILYLILIIVYNMCIIINK